MKKIFILAIAVSALYACGNKSAKTEVTEILQEVSDIHNAKNSLDYHGTYVGVLPAADTEGIETTIMLTDSTYSRGIAYIGKMNILPVETDKYTWNSEGNIITLEGAEKPNQYFVSENKLFALDMSGQRITGDLADNYILTKK